MHLTVQTCDRLGVQQDHCPMYVQPAALNTHFLGLDFSLFSVPSTEMSKQFLLPKLLQRYLHLQKEVKLVVFQQAVRKRSENTQVL